MRNVKSITFEFPLPANPHAIMWIKALPYVEDVRLTTDGLIVIASYAGMQPYTPDRVVQDILEMVNSVPGE